MLGIMNEQTFHTDWLYNSNLKVEPPPTEVQINHIVKKKITEEE